MTVVVILSRRRSELAAWVASRSPREQALLAAAALLAVVVLFATLVWRPLQAARADALADIRAYDAVRAQILAGGPRLAQRAAQAGTPPATLVTQTAAQAGLVIRRLQPTGSRIEAALEDAEFDKVMTWLERLEREGGLGIVSLKLERRPAPGIVNVQLTLAGG